MPLGLGLGITKLKSLVSGLRVRFQGNATITAALDGILRELSADFVSNGTVTAALEAIKLLDVDFSGDGTLTADLASFEGLLDLYPNAAAAYSVRLLKSDYTGALVRIRKDTGGQPEKDFYPDSNNELSLNSSDGGTTLGSWIGSNDGYIVTWYDQSGNSGRDVTNSTASKQPQILSGGALITENGKAAVDFDGASNQLTSSFGTTLNQPTYSFLTHNFTAIPAAFDGVIGSIGSEHRLILGGSLTYAIQAGGALSYNSYSLNQCLLTYKMLASDPKLFFNGTQQTVSSGTSIGSKGLEGIILAGISSGASFGNTPIKIQEYILYNSNEDSNRGGIETNINDFFTIF